MYLTLTIKGHCPFQVKELPAYQSQTWTFPFTTTSTQTTHELSVGSMSGMYDIWCRGKPGIPLVWHLTLISRMDDSFLFKIATDTITNLTWPYFFTLNSYTTSFYVENTHWHLSSFPVKSPLAISSIFNKFEYNPHYKTSQKSVHRLPRYYSQKPQQPPPSKLSSERSSELRRHVL